MCVHLCMTYFRNEISWVDPHTRETFIIFTVYITFKKEILDVEPVNQPLEKISVSTVLLFIQHTLMLSVYFENLYHS